MIAKRLAAVGVTIALIATAWIVRDRVIEDDPDDGEPSSAAATEVICISELREVCRQAVEGLDDDLAVTIADAADTLAGLTTASSPRSIWITLTPYPGMVDFLRGRAGAPALGGETAQLATSPLALIVSRDRTDEFASSCPGNLTWTCIGEQTQLSPTFAPIDTAIGAVSVAVAIEQYGGPGVDFDDLGLLTWARGLRRSGASSLSGGTAVATIQTRPTFGVAIGAEAELASTRQADFDVLYAEPMTTLDVVAFAPDGVELPGDLVTAMRTALAEAGWDSAGSGPATAPGAELVLAAIDYWRRLG